MPKYDRELIARMLLGPRVYSPESVAEQARLLREADNLEADARTVVREVPDGMVLVPREPTDAMKAAGAACFPNRWGNGDATDGEDAADCYREMLSAASGEKGVGGA